LVLLVFFLLSTKIVVAQGCEKFIGSECADLKWKVVRPGTGDVAEIVISPNNPNIMYTGMENNAHALYKSADGGKSWRRVKGPFDHAKDMAVSPTDPNKVYVAMSENVHTTDLSITPTTRSRYGSMPNIETQSILSSGSLPGGVGVSFSTLEIFEQDDNIIYAALKGSGFGGFPGSFPGGLPGDMPGGFPDVTGHQIGYPPSTGTMPSSFKPAKAEIFKTTNAGASWTSVKHDLEINVIAIHPSNHNIIYIGAEDGIYVSRDSGKTIELLKKVSDVLSVELQLDNPNVIYISSLSKVFKSIDGGNSWNDIAGPLKDIHRVRISRSNPNVLYASTFNGVFRSDDFGGIWNDVSGNLKAKNIQIVTIHPKNPDIAFAGTSTLWWPFRGKLLIRGLYAHQGIFKTMDGGKTWIRSDSGIFEYNIEEVSTNPGRPYEAWYAGQASRGSLKTIDAGHNWRQSPGAVLHYPMRVKFSFNDPDIVYATTWGRWVIGKSKDGGISWTTLATPEAFFNGLNRGKGLYKPSGPQGQMHVHGFAIDPRNEDVLYAGSIDDPLSSQFVAGGFPLEGAHIFKSTNAGKTWQESDEGFPHEKQTSIHDIQINPKDTSTIYVTTTKHESKIGIGIYKSTDSGKTWKAINSGLGDLSVATIAIHPENTEILLAATESGLYRSNNAGQSWKRTSKSSSFDVEYVKENPDVVYASTDDGVLKSKDFGDTWYAVNRGLPKGKGHGIGVDPTGNVIYAAVQKEGLYVARLINIAPIEAVTEITERYLASKKEPVKKEEYIEKEPTLEECQLYELPEDCTTIEDLEQLSRCKVCKALEVINKSGQKKENKTKVEELKEIKDRLKKPNFFDIIINFFKRLFN